MGKLKNFEKFEFQPFSIRIGNLEAANFYREANYEKKSMQSHLNLTLFSFFQIVKWEKHIQDSQIETHWHDGIPKVEFCYMLASWENMDHDELTPDLSFVSNRPLQLSDEEREVFFRIAKFTQNHIEEELEKNCKKFERLWE